jgi:RNA polymerase sigma factor (sigma-70 family)
MNLDLDEMLVRAATQGDNAAFVVFCVRRVPEASGFFAKVLGRRWESIASQVAEAFLRATVAWASGVDESMPPGWPPDVPRDAALLELRRAAYGELLRIAVSGDDAAYVLFCTLAIPDLQDSLKVMCRRWTVPPDLASDFAHDTLSRAVTWLGKKKPDGPLWPGWLPRVMRHVVIDWMRRNKGPGRAQSNQGRKLAEVSARQDDGYLDWDLERVRRAFRALDTFDRRLLDLIIIQGQTQELAAAELEVQTSEIGPSLQKALNYLKALLDEDKVRTAMQALSEEDCHVIEGVLFQGQSPPALLPGLKKWTAYKRYERAVGRLRMELEVIPGIEDA